MEFIQIITGDCRTILKTLPDQSVQCCVTSPPYWGLRDYGHADQIGLEETPAAYVETMREVFAEIWRVLRDDGTLWLNLGDSYSGSGKGGNPDSGKQATNKGSQTVGTLYGKTGESARQAAVTNVSRRLCAEHGMKAKDLIGIPWRVALALQQPFEESLIKEKTDRAWLAAMIDSEGCINIPEAKSPHGSGSSFPPIIQIRMCDTECLLKCVELVGKGGNLNKQMPPPYASENQRPAYQWRINGATVSAVLADIYPYLLIKRKQACIAWTLQKIRESYFTKKGVPIPGSALLKQQECRRLIGLLNQRQTVDLPTWIEEPNQIVHPGWYLRSDVIWHKPNPMPESVTDRPTRSHEYIFLLTKSAKYFYDSDAIREPALFDDRNGFRGENDGPTHYANQPKAPDNSKKFNKRMGGGGSSFVGHSGNQKANGEPISDGWRNKRDVWTVTTSPYPDAHFATFPPDLIKPCILAGTKPGDVVLDPFGGSGTTGMVALELGRRAVLIELNPDYCKLCDKRCDTTRGLPL